MMRKMRKITALLLTSVMLLSGTAMVSAATTQAKSLAIKGSVKTVYVGQKEEFDSRVTPAYVDVPDRDYVWTSSNSKVLKVLEKNDDDTEVKGIKAGTATLTVKIKGTKLTASREITVKKNTSTSVKSYEKKIISYKKSLKDIRSDMKSAKVKNDDSSRYQQARTFERKIEKIEDKLDALEDAIEYKYDSGKITRKQYRSLEKKIEAVEDYIDDLEDYLEDKFGDFED